MKSLYLPHNETNEMKMYILVNTSVKMSKGKIAAQVGHAVQKTTERMLKQYPKKWKEYISCGIPKIVLKSDINLLENLINKYPTSNRNTNIWCEYIIDAGRTQIPPNTLTCLAFCPLKTEDVPDEITTLKLL